MKNFGYLFALLAIVTFSCSDVSDPIQTCDVDNVLTDLPWLADLLEEQESHQIGQAYSYLSSGKYKSKRVFILSNCCPYCLSLPNPVYDCAGNMLGRLYADDIEPDKVKDQEIIWRSSDNSCSI
jgi:hypothetical protein